MGRNNLSGAWGEAVAAAYLQKKRYTLVAAGFRCRYGEIDLIVSNKKYLVFVEVKTRNTNAIVRGGEAVNYHKRQCLIKTASAYLAEHSIDKFCRFDVSEVYVHSDTLKLQSLNYIENAFSLE
jgi:putative endonuclease